MKPPHEETTTHFGYQQVPPQKKSALVGEIFNSVADRYNVMNDVMSLGLHRLWKRTALMHANLRSGMKVLDVAAGTGDMAKAIAKKVGSTGQVVVTDINNAMLEKGRDHLIDAGLVANIYYVQADAECLPFAANYFDCITIAFGLRNVTYKEQALQSMYRLLKPGGKLIILEFSHPTTTILNKIYDFYSFNIIPKMGKYIANDEKSYQYLVESIRMHPNQETLKNLMQTAQFETVNYFNLNGGIVAIHTGYKY